MSRLTLVTFSYLVDTGIGRAGTLKHGQVRSIFQRGRGHLRQGGHQEERLRREGRVSRKMGMVGFGEVYRNSIGEVYRNSIDRVVKPYDRPRRGGLPQERLRREGQQDRLLRGGPQPDRLRRGGRFQDPLFFAAL
ncbi:unnamed protein product [Sphagnum tenellum]